MLGSAKAYFKKNRTLILATTYGENKNSGARRNPHVLPIKRRAQLPGGESTNGCANRRFWWASTLYIHFVQDIIHTPYLLIRYGSTRSEEVYQSLGHASIKVHTEYQRHGLSNVGTDFGVDI